MEKGTRRSCSLILVARTVLSQMWSSVALKSYRCHTTTIIQKLNMDGIVLSSGPGDPAEYTFMTEKIKAFMDEKETYAGYLSGTSAYGPDCGC